MLYWLFVDPGPLSDVMPGTNVFRYISFRTAWGMITALMVSYLVFPSFIHWMKQRKVDQIIRSDGPESHLLTKVGTPTMGGVPMIAGIVLASLLWGRLDVAPTWMVLIVTVGFGAVGFVDDWKKVMERNTAGLSGRTRLFFECLIGGAVLGYGYVAGVYSVDLSFRFFADFSIDFAELWPGAPAELGWLYVAFALFVLVGAANAVNLTDGLDGLAIGPVMTAAATYGLIAYLTGHAEFSEHLGIPVCGGHWGAHGHRLRGDWSWPWIPLVQRISCVDLHGRRGVTVVGRDAGDARRALEARGAPRDRWGHLRIGDVERDHSGHVVQAHRQAGLCDGPHSSPLREVGLVGTQDHCQILDHQHRVGAGSPLYPQASVVRCSSSLGAGCW